MNSSLKLRITKVSKNGAKETKTSEKTGKYQRKKRFGKSIANKAPALFVSILEYKCNYLHAKFNKINTWTAKASQYNHESEEYEKKKLHQRWRHKYKLIIRYSAATVFRFFRIRLLL